MAEPGDGGTSRMLFTDMDVSDKGRPEAFPGDADGSGYAAPVPRLRTIDDILSSLELDFEDDADADAPDGDADSGPVENPAHEAKPQAGESDASRDKTAAELPRAQAGSGPDAGTAAMDTSSSGPAGGPLPTWEQYTKTFRSRTTGIVAEKAAPLEEEAASPNQPLPSDHEGPEREEATPHAWTPSGAESEEDGEEAGGRDPVSEFSLPNPDDSDYDILSVLPPLPPDVMEAVPEWRGGRLGVRAAPEEAYGGLERLDDWFAPPEQPETATEDWYEPPERAGGDTDSVLRALDQLDPATMGLFGDGNTTSVFAPPARWPGEEQGSDPDARDPDTRSIDLFSGIDLDGLWRDRLRDEEDSSLSLSDTHLLSLLNEMSAQDIPPPRAGPESSTPPPAAASRPEAGVPDPSDPRFARTQPDPNDTAIVDMEDILVPADELAFGQGQAPGEAVPAGEDLPADDDEDDRDILAEAALYEAEEAYSQPTDGSGPMAADPGPPVEEEPASPTGPISEGAAAVMDAFGLDNLDIDSLFLDDESAGDRTIQAPIISNDDISEITDGKPRRRRRRPAAKLDGPEESGAGAEEDDYIPGLPADGEDGEAFDPDLADSPDGGEEVEESPVPAGMKGLTPEDLMRDLDLDGEGPAFNAEISAPVIDDSAIHDLESGPTDTQELKALDDWQRPPKSQPGTDSAVDPHSAFAALDGMDFSGEGLEEEDDDESREEINQDDEEGAQAEGESEPGEGRAAMAWSVAGRFGRQAARMALRRVPEKWVRWVGQTVALEENWRFYCDLAAAVITSASLAVILSYHLWYRR